jgi:hypothetical protein
LPRFSVFIPVRNGAAWIEGAIESVLAQTYTHWELIIGDNVSSDGLEIVLDRYADDARIRHHRWATVSDVSENFNRTRLLSQYEWILPLCADDRLDPRCLELMADRVSKVVARSTRLTAVVGAACRVDVDGRPADDAYYGYRGRAHIPSGLHDSASWLWHSLTGVTPWNIGTVAFRRTVLDEMGVFMRAEIGLCADLELMLRASAYGDIEYIDEPLMQYVIRPGGDSKSRGFTPHAWAQPLPPVALALVAGLAAHEARRPVSRRERSAVASVVALVRLQRALQHRYCPGGQGRRGALREIRRAIAASPRTMLRATTLVYGLVAALCPSALIGPLRSAVLARKYAGAGAAADSADSLTHSWSAERRHVT